MCRTKIIKWVALAAMASALVAPVGAQTIGELAESQRAKLRAEIAQRNAAAEVAAAKAGESSVKPAQAAASRPLAARQAEAPRLRVHSLYERSGKWRAEVTDGNRLATPEPGMKFGGYSVEAINEKGLHLVRAEPCKKAEKSCQLQRVVGVGGVL